MRANPAPRAQHAVPAPSLDGLAAEARKAGSWERFRRDWNLQIKHGLYWHVTSDPRFDIDPRKGPMDMSSLGSNSVDIGKLMVTSDLAQWADFYNDPDHVPERLRRRWAAMVDMRRVPRDSYLQSSRGFGNEFWVDDPRQARVVSVMPLDEALAYDASYDALLPQSEEELALFYRRSVGR
jgi:hypothetical protein